jgi:hypothetical protein
VLEYALNKNILVALGPQFRYVVDQNLKLHDSSLDNEFFGTPDYDEFEFGAN